MGTERRKHSSSAWKGMPLGKVATTAGDYGTCTCAAANQKSAESRQATAAWGGEEGVLGGALKRTTANGIM